MKASKTLDVKTVGIVLKPRSVTEYSSLLPNLVKWLKRRKISVLFIDGERGRIDKIFKGKTENFKFVDESSMHTQSQLNITLGGDGTLLGFGRKSLKNSAPVLGVNMGNLGFITEYTKAEFFDSLELTLKSAPTITHVPLFKVQVFKQESKIFESHFLNDAVVSKHDISRMFTVGVECEDIHVYQLSGDGLIIGSPVGSTAYNLAAGGPIIHPSVNALSLTPICPHGLNHRPLVVSNKSKLRIKIPARSDSIQLTLDGQEHFELPSRCEVIITKSSTRKVSLIKNTERHYFQTLKDKFTHGRRN